MTSTNDGKDIKSNQTSGHKGKSYYIDLYKSLDSQLNESGDARAVSAAWRRVHTLCLHSAPTTHSHLLTWIQRHTAQLLLQSKWQSSDSKDQHTLLEDALKAFLQESQEAIDARNGASPRWEVQLRQRAVWIQENMAKPWDHPVLRVLLDTKAEPPGTDEILEWLKVEHGIMFVTRLRQLAASKCDDLAANLASAVMDRVRAERDIVPDVEQIEDKGSTWELKPSSFENILRTEAGFTDEVWDLLKDIEFVLLHKRGRNAKLIELAKQTPLNNTYQLVERLLSRSQAFPKEKKLWKNTKEVAILFTQVIIARCMVIPECVGSCRGALYWCARALARLLPSARLPRDAATLAAPAATAKHLHTFATAVHAQQSDSGDMQPFVCELYVRAITFGMNELEKLKLNTEKEKEARSMEQTLAGWFIQLGQLLGSSARMRGECALTAFSVHPSHDMYEKVKDTPELPRVVTDTQEEKTKPESTSEFGSWATDSRSQTNFVKTSETLNMKHQQNQTNVLSTAIFNEGETLGLSAELCQDIAVLLSGPRVKTFSWDMDRNVLLENCRAYMERTHGGTRALSTELKYLNLDLTKFQHLPEEENDENDIYYGIEKGYEHHIEFEPQPEQIWQDAEWEDELLDNYSDTSSSNENDDYKPRQTKSRQLSVSDSEDDSDPLSIGAEPKRSEKKKERPHSKERSKERKKKSKSKESKEDEARKERSISKERQKDEAQDKTKERSRSQEKKEKKKEKKERKKRKKQGMTELIGMKVANLDIGSTPSLPDNKEDTSSNIECDSQLSMDELKLKGPDRPIHKNTNSGDFTHPTTQQIENRSLTGKTVPTAKTSAAASDHVKRSIHKLLQFRKNKQAEARKNATANQTSQNTSGDNAIRQKPLTMSTLVGSKIMKTSKITMKKKQKEQLNAANFDGVNKGKKIKTYGKDSCSRTMPLDINRKKTTTTQNAPIHKPENLQHDARQTEINDPAKSQQIKADTHLKSYEQFLKELKTSNNAGVFVECQDKNNDERDKTKREMRPVSRVTPIVPHGNGASKSSPNILRTPPNLSRPQVTSSVPSPQGVPLTPTVGDTPRVTPIPSVPAMTSKPETITSQSAKLQQKKAETAPHTFARLSYLHKNKPKQIVDMTTQLNKQITAELDRRIADLKIAKIMQSKREVIINRVPTNQTEKTIPKVEVQREPSLVTQNPLLCNILKNNHIPATTAAATKLIPSVVQQTPSTSKNAVTTPKNSALSEKDHQDLLKLLCQQNKMNSIKTFEKVQSVVTNPLPGSNIPIAPPRLFSKDIPSSMTPSAQITATLEKANINMPETSSNKSNVVKLTKVRRPVKTKNCVALNADNSSLANKSLLLSGLNVDDIKQGKVNTSEPNKEWTEVLDALRAQKTPSRGPNAIDVFLKKDSFDKYSEVKVQTQPMSKVFSNKAEAVAFANKAEYVSNTTKSVVVVPMASQNKSLPVPKLTQPITNPIVQKTDIDKSNQIQNPVNVAQHQKSKFENVLPKDDPFISGIPNSDYEMLEELMDDDLRQEIGELLSEDENYVTEITHVPKVNANMKNYNISNAVNKQCIVQQPSMTNTCTNNASQIVQLPVNVENNNTKPKTIVSLNPVQQPNIINTCTNNASQIVQLPVNVANNDAKPKTIVSLNSGIRILSNQKVELYKAPETVIQRPNVVLHNYQNVSSPMPTTSYSVNSNNCSRNQVQPQPATQSNIYVGSVPQPSQSVVVISSEIIYEPYRVYCNMNQTPLLVNAQNNISHTVQPQLLGSTITLSNVNTNLTVPINSVVNIPQNVQETLSSMGTRTAEKAFIENNLTDAGNNTRFLGSGQEKQAYIPAATAQLDFARETAHLNFKQSVASQENTLNNNSRTETQVYFPSTLDKPHLTKEMGSSKKESVEICQHNPKDNINTHVDLTTSQSRRGLAKAATKLKNNEFMSLGQQQPQDFNVNSIANITASKAQSCVVKEVVVSNINDCKSTCMQKPQSDTNKTLPHILAPKRQPSFAKEMANPKVTESVSAEQMTQSTNINVKPNKQSKAQTKTSKTLLHNLTPKRQPSFAKEMATPKVTESLSPKPMTQSIDINVEANKPSEPLTKTTNTQTHVAVPKRLPSFAKEKATQKITESISPEQMTSSTDMNVKANIPSKPQTKTSKTPSLIIAPERQRSFTKGMATPKVAENISPEQMTPSTDMNVKGNKPTKPQTKTSETPSYILAPKRQHSFTKGMATPKVAENISPEQMTQSTDINVKAHKPSKPQALTGKTVSRNLTPKRQPSFAKEMAASKTAESISPEQMTQSTDINVKANKPSKPQTKTSNTQTHVAASKRQPSFGKEMPAQKVTESISPEPLTQSIDDNVEANKPSRLQTKTVIAQTHVVALKQEPSFTKEIENSKVENSITSQQTTQNNDISVKFNKSNKLQANFIKDIENFNGNEVSQQQKPQNTSFNAETIEKEILIQADINKTKNKQRILMKRLAILERSQNRPALYPTIELTYAPLRPVEKKILTPVTNDDTIKNTSAHIDGDKSFEVSCCEVNPSTPDNNSMDSTKETSKENKESSPCRMSLLRSSHRVNRKSRVDVNSTKPTEKNAKVHPSKKSMADGNVIGNTVKEKPVLTEVPVDKEPNTEREQQMVENHETNAKVVPVRMSKRILNRKTKKGKEKQTIIYEIQQASDLNPSQEPKVIKPQMNEKVTWEISSKQRENKEDKLVLTAHNEGHTQKSNNPQKKKSQEENIVGTKLSPEVVEIIESSDSISAHNELEITDTTSENFGSPRRSRNGGKVSHKSKMTKLVKEIECVINEITKECIVNPSHVNTENIISDDLINNVNNNLQEINEVLAKNSTVNSTQLQTTRKQNNDLKSVQSSFRALENKCKQQQNADIPILSTTSTSKKKSIPVTDLVQKPKNIATEETSPVTDTNQDLQSYKDSISFEELPQIDPEDPFKKVFRVKLPNGKAFKATIHGKTQVDIDTLFEQPALRNVLLSGLTDKKRYTLNVQQVMTRQTVLETTLQAVNVECTKKVEKPEPKINGNEFVDTINLISDDEDELPAANSFVTEFGKYKIHGIDKDVFSKHQTKLLQKCVIQLSRCQSPVAATVKPVSIIKNPNLNLPVLADEDIVLSSSSILLPENTIETIVPDNVRSPPINDVIEIDDSSDESVHVIESLPPLEKITSFKNLLLKDLGVIDDIVPTTTPSRKNEKASENTLSDMKSKNTEQIQTKTKSDEKRKNRRRNTMKKKEEILARLIKQECCVKLVRCDDLIKEHVNVHNEANGSNDSASENLNTDFSATDTILSPLSRSGSFSILNDLTLDDMPVVGEETKSPIVSTFEILSDIETLDRSSPVIEAFDLIARAQNRFSSSVGCDKQENFLNIPGSCTAEWFSTKSSLRNHALNVISGFSEIYLDDKTDASTDCGSDLDSTLALNEEDSVITFQVPRLASIMARYFEDNPLVIQRIFDGLNFQVPKLTTIMARYFENNPLLSRLQYWQEEEPLVIQRIFTGRNLQVPKLTTIMARYFEDNSLLSRLQYWQKEESNPLVINYKVPKLRTIMTRYFEDNSLLSRLQYWQKEESAVEKISSPLKRKIQCQEKAIASKVTKIISGTDSDKTCIDEVIQLCVGNLPTNETNALNATLKFEKVDVVSASCEKNMDQPKINTNTESELRKEAVISIAEETSNKHKEDVETSDTEIHTALNDIKHMNIEPASKSNNEPSFEKSNELTEENTECFTCDLEDKTKVLSTKAFEEDITTVDEAKVTQKIGSKDSVEACVVGSIKDATQCHLNKDNIEVTQERNENNSESLIPDLNDDMSEKSNELTEENMEFFTCDLEDKTKVLSTKANEEDITTVDEAKVTQKIGSEDSLEAGIVGSVIDVTQCHFNKNNIEVAQERNENNSEFPIPDLNDDMSEKSNEINEENMESFTCDLEDKTKVLSTKAFEEDITTVDEAKVTQKIGSKDSVEACVVGSIEDATQCHLNKDNIEVTQERNENNSESLIPDLNDDMTEKSNEIHEENMESFTCDLEDKTKVLSTKAFEEDITTVDEAKVTQNIGSEDSLEVDIVGSVINATQCHLNEDNIEVAQEMNENNSVSPIPDLNDDMDFAKEPIDKLKGEMKHSNENLDWIGVEMEVADDSYTQITDHTQTPKTNESFEQPSTLSSLCYKSIQCDWQDNNNRQIYEVGKLEYHDSNEYNIQSSIVNDDHRYFKVKADIQEISSESPESNGTLSRNQIGKSFEDLSIIDDTCSEEIKCCMLQEVQNTNVQSPKDDNIRETEDLKHTEEAAITTSSILNNMEAIPEKSNLSSEDCYVLPPKPANPECVDIINKVVDLNDTTKSEGDLDGTAGSLEDCDVDMLSPGENSNTDDSKYTEEIISSDLENTVINPEEVPENVFQSLELRDENVVLPVNEVNSNADKMSVSSDDTLANSDEVLFKSFDSIESPKSGANSDEVLFKSFDSIESPNSGVIIKGIEYDDPELGTCYVFPLSKRSCTSTPTEASDECSQDVELATELEHNYKTPTRDEITQDEVFDECSQDVELDHNFKNSARDEITQGETLDECSQDVEIATELDHNSKSPTQDEITQDETFDECPRDVELATELDHNSKNSTRDKIYQDDAFDECPQDVVQVLDLDHNSKSPPQDHITQDEKSYESPQDVELATELDDNTKSPTRDEITQYKASYECLPDDELATELDQNSKSPSQNEITQDETSFESPQDVEIATELDDNTKSRTRDEITQDKASYECLPDDELATELDHNSTNFTQDEIKQDERFDVCPQDVVQVLDLDNNSESPTQDYITQDEASYKSPQDVELATELDDNIKSLSRDEITQDKASDKCPLDVDLATELDHNYKTPTRTETTQDETFDERPQDIKPATDLDQNFKSPIPDEITQDEQDEVLKLIQPKVTYIRPKKKRKFKSGDMIMTVKRRRQMKNTKTRANNINSPIKTALMDASYIEEYTRLFDYYDSIELSYAVAYSKDYIDVPSLIKEWPIKGPCNQECKEDIEIDRNLFAGDNDNAIFDPIKMSVSEEIRAANETTDINCDNTVETNTDMGFGERSGRVIQNLEHDDEILKFSAATLSDVKLPQPFLLYENQKYSNKRNFQIENHDQLDKIRRCINFFQLKTKVKSFFENTEIELNKYLPNMYKEKEQAGDVASFPYDLYIPTLPEPSVTNFVVQVVQVGQLPVSAAAQNPVTCDPRVTQVSDASPPQCSADNSPHDGSQAIKTEYTELTTAELPLVTQDYVQENPDLKHNYEEPRNKPKSTENIPIETEIKIEIKDELDSDNQEETNERRHNVFENVDLNAQVNNIQYPYESKSNECEQNISQPFVAEKQPETFTVQKATNGAPEKMDQIAHAMNAAGIATTETVINNNTSTNTFVNLLSQKILKNSAPNTTNDCGKTINAMALQQALAQILPPPLNQTSNNTENNQQNQSTVTPQVLHIVQGKNATGNQITLVDNSQSSVINASNATPVLHIVQNKTGTSVPTNGVPSQQGNSFSGLSLVDAGIQQGGNQLLHIVNTGNQKNNNTGQLLKRVNLLTNLANVQGSNEQKLVQFVCKSADGKSIQLNAGQQRGMVLRLQPIETPNVQTPTSKPESQEFSPTPNATTSSKDSNNQEIKSRSIYEENYAKFIQNVATKTQVLEKSTSLPKFNQAFGKQVFQDGAQKQNDIGDNLPSVPAAAESTENTQPAEGSINLENIAPIGSPPLLLRKTSQASQPQSNLVQQIKQTIAPMNIQTMHGGVIYTRQIPINIAGGQTINLITVPSTEVVDESGQKQQGDVKYQSEIEPSIIKIVPQTQTTPNSEATSDDGNTQINTSTETTQNSQPQPVLTQMRIKLPMLSKTPQMVPGARVVRPSFFQIQRNVIGGTNQPVYQQLVLTAAPPLGQQTIRLPQSQTRTFRIESQSSESNMSSSTLEQLREFDMVLEQVRSTGQPNVAAPSNFKFTSSTDTTDSSVSTSSTPTETTQVFYSIGGNQPLNVAYVNRKAAVTTSTFARSPDSSGIVDSPSSSNHVQIPQSSTAEASTSEATTAPSKPKFKSKSRPKHHHSPRVNSTTPKASTQKPLEDEQTTQRILYILAEYKEQVENSPDKDKPAPRRRTNPPTNPGSSKRKKSSSGSRRPGTRDMSPVLGEDTCRTMGSEDSSCGTSQGDCSESFHDAHETQSPQDSPRKVARKLTFEQERPATPPPRTSPVPQRNVIVADGQTITVARGTAGKPTTAAVLMPANYILPVSMVKGGQQIAIVTNRGPKLLTVGGGEGGATNALLLQRLIGPAGLKPVLSRPGVRHVRLPTAALHNLQAFNVASATSSQPADSTASPASAHTSPDVVDTNATNSSWTDRESESTKPNDRASSPESSWHMQSAADPNDYCYEETVRADNLDRTVLEPIPDRYSPDMEAQRIFDKMFDVETKKSYAVESHEASPRCGYDIDATDCDDKHYQVVHKKDGSGHRQHRLTQVSAAALRHKYAILEHELRLQKSLSEECEDLGVDSPSASELFPEAELLFANSPAHDHAQDAIQHSNTPQPIIYQNAIQPDIDDQIATDHLLQQNNTQDEQQDLNLGLEDVGIVTVNEDGMATIALDQEEFARSHPNTTFHSEPTDDAEVQPYTITGLKGRQISTIFHANRAPATVLMTAPQTTVISQATAASSHAVKYADIDNIIDHVEHIPGPHNNNVNLSSVLVKDDGLTRYDNILTDTRELHLSNTASAIVHAVNTTQVIRRVYDEKRERDTSFLMDEPDALIAGDDAKMVAEDSRDETLVSMAREVDDGNSSPERHTELFWESNSASERSESRRPLDFSSDSDKCCKSPLYDTNSTDSSGVGTHMRLDSVIKEARQRRGSADGSSADDTHPPLRTYPAKRVYHSAEAEMERSLSGKTRAGERSSDMEVRRRASVRGVVKRGCHCCNGSPAPQRPKKPRQRKPTMDFNSHH